MSKIVKDLAAQIAEKLDSNEPSAILDAVRLVDELPGPEAHPPDTTVLLIYEVAQKAEMLEDNGVSIRLFQRVLEYQADNPQFRAGAWFRIGLAYQRVGDFGGAIDGFRRALAVPECWFELAGLIRYRLASLLAETEEYDDAVGLLHELQREYLPNPHIEAHAVTVLLARSLLMSGKPDAALSELEPIAAAPAAEWTARIQSLRAEIFESMGRMKDARDAYTRIVENPHARQELRTAAAYRLSALR